MINEAELNNIEERAEISIHQLSKIVSDGLKLPPGPYAFFYHCAHALERLQDCQRILKRLFTNRSRLTVLNYQAEMVMPTNWPAGVPYPEKVQKIMKEANEISSYMKQDLESLYMFGGILLDQWSLLAICIGKLPLPKKHPFTELVGFFESSKSSILDPIWSCLKENILWLHYQLRFYRNRFVVHANRPWQRGTTCGTYGEDFNLFIPTPPGWIDDNKFNYKIRELMHLAPEHIQEAPDDYWEKANAKALLERIFNNIGNIESKADREKVASIFGEVGGSTPSFQIIAQRLFEFIAFGTELLNNIIKDNLNKIDIGSPDNNSSKS